MKVKGQWMYLYRAVDSKGNTIDFHVSNPRVITVDKNPAFPNSLSAQYVGCPLLRVNRLRTASVSAVPSRKDVAYLII